MGGSSWNPWEDWLKLIDLESQTSTQPPLERLKEDIEGRNGGRVGEPSHVLVCQPFKRTNMVQKQGNNWKFCPAAFKLQVVDGVKICVWALVRFSTRVVVHRQWNPKRTDGTFNEPYIPVSPITCVTHKHTQKKIPNISMGNIGNTCLKLGVQVAQPLPAASATNCRMMSPPVKKQWKRNAMECAIAKRLRQHSKSSHSKGILVN